MLSYIKKTPGKRLVYRKNGHLHIKTYSDSGYAGDKGDRSLLPVIALMLEATLSYGVVRNRMLSLYPVLNPSIDPWHRPLVK